MPTSRSYHSYLIESLKDPQEAAAYLEAVLEEGDDEQLRLALNNIVEAQIAATSNQDALLSMTDEEIDYSDIPPLTDEFFENATLTIPATNLIELDPDVLAWFQAQGKEYKIMINSDLRRYIHDRSNHHKA